MNDNLKNIMNGKIVNINNGNCGEQAYIEIETVLGDIVLLTNRPGGKFRITILKEHERSEA